ncbi:MAG: M23 family metallopeptidase [Desulfuromonadaceae bacterium]|nr:M23 family metallopeptidase [Desulfuromonadaceae bacterium]
MKRSGRSITTILFCLLLAYSTAFAAPSPAATSMDALCANYNKLNTMIRDSRISKVAARLKLSVQLSEIRTEYYQKGGKNYVPSEWVFPLAGYDARAIDKGKHHGFIPYGYDFFSGNRHGGHPAYDIFIRDRNQDCRDDQSGNEVEVLSMTGGIVVALDKKWQAGSGLRGGNYIWIFDPTNELLVYYAHNEELFVEPGTIVKPGDLLATVGRSGFNAAKRRSPTHLHFSVLRVRDGQPVPLDVYRELQQTRRVPDGSIN